MAIKASTAKTTAATASATTAKPLAGVTADPAAESETAAPAAPGLNFVRRKEFVSRVVASSGLKPNAVKSVMDAVLKELGDALSNGEALQLPPLGKLSVNRRKDLKNGEMLVCKLRRTTPPEKSDDTLADAAE